MTSDIINLRQARKQRERDKKNKKSAVQRVKFGQSKSDQDVLAFNRQKFEKKLDDHKRDDTSGDDA